MVVDESDNYLVVDIYSLCRSLADSQPISIQPIKLDKDKSDFTSTWLVKIKRNMSETVAVYLDDLSKYEVEAKLVTTVCDILYK